MKLPARHAPHLHVALLTACMAVVMSISLTIIRNGTADGLLVASMRNAAVAFPIALLATTIVGPLVRRLVAQLTEPPTDDRCRGTRPRPMNSIQEGEDCV